VATVRAAVDASDAESYESAIALIDLAGKLNLHANLERAQEIVYEALQHARDYNEQHMPELAAKLGLAPSLSHVDAPPLPTLTTSESFVESVLS
jgi:hypothetical protein